MEAHLFNTHEELKKVRSSCKGIPALVEKLICVQKDRLEKCIPDIFAQVRGTSNHIAIRCLDYESFFNYRYAGFISSALLSKYGLRYCFGGILDFICRFMHNLYKDGSNII